MEMGGRTELERGMEKQIGRKEDRERWKETAIFLNMKFMSNWFPYNTRFSSQQVPSSIPISHPPLLPTPHLHCWWECKLMQPLWKTVWGFLKKLNIELPYDPAITLLGIYPRDTGVLFWRGLYTPMFIAALSTSQRMERAQMSIDRWMDKEDVVSIYNGVLLGNHKEWNLASLQLHGWN